MSDIWGLRQLGALSGLSARVPHPDQWLYLAGLRRIAPSTVERIANDATRKGLVIGVRAADLGDTEEDRSPWMHPPSGRAPRREVPGPLPQSEGLPEGFTWT